MDSEVQILNITRKNEKSTKDQKQKLKLGMESKLETKEGIDLFIEKL